MARRLQQLEKQVGQKYSFESILGKSKPIRMAVELARKVSVTDVPVLLTGETGTGKEVFAQAIHQHSSRAGKAFVAVNCSAFSKELLESEIFGHKAGAFTGALKERKDCSRKPIRERSFWMRSVKWLSICRRNYYGYWKVASS